MHLRGDKATCVSLAPVEHNGERGVRSMNRVDLEPFLLVKSKLKSVWCLSVSRASARRARLAGRLARVLPRRCVRACAGVYVGHPRWSVVGGLDLDTFLDECCVCFVVCCVCAVCEFCL